jgi:hypothetical protein
MHPITLTGDEYQELINTLASRDPLIAALMRKQAEAQAAAKPATSALDLSAKMVPVPNAVLPSPKTPKP